MSDISIQKDYEKFLAEKRVSARPVGFNTSYPINEILFSFQKDIVQWALRKGRAAVFADCGLGKGLIQIEWAWHVHRYTSQPVLVLAPLAVAPQTVREAEKLGLQITICESQDDVTSGLNVTNYEKLHRFSPEVFGGIVLDESSILKSFDGTTRKAITEFARNIYYRLACTATPAPNDLIELTNHAEFLDVMSGKEIIALFFTQDGNTTHNWRLKGHAKRDFWKWLASWSVAMRRPSDLGYEDGLFVLPKLKVEQITVDSPILNGKLFVDEAKTLTERRAAKKDSLESRVAATAELVNSCQPEKQWLVWCNLNIEADALKKAIPDAVEVHGNHSEEYKRNAVTDFISGKIRVLISKPSMFGFGLNLQCCSRMVFVGLSDSFEQLYQGTRRCWRFGQTEEVESYHIVSEAEGSIVTNLQRKEAQAAEMMEEIVKEMKDITIEELHQQTEHLESDYVEDIREGTDYKFMLGSSVRRMKEIESDSVGLTIYSPPFPGMYAYSASAEDVGNCESIDQMIEHFKFMIPEMYRIAMPGRMNCIHLCQLTAMKNRDGYIGLKDYRGRIIEAMIEGGWVYAGEVTIDKNPQIQATRNKERGLLFKSLATDSAMMRMALADYLIYFRKPGDNPIPIRAGISEKYKNPDGWITEQEWVEWASPVWYRHMSAEGKNAEYQPNYPALMAEAKHIRHKQDGLTALNGIMETDVLNVVQARETDDERHLCPLQLSVIERAIKLWSAPGDTVFSPFGGVGSEGYMALKLFRKFIGCELKGSYWASGCANLERALKERSISDQVSLFDMINTASESELEEVA